MLLISHRMLRDKDLIYPLFFLEYVFHHLQPGSLFHDLTPKAVLDRAVEQGEVDTPLSAVGLRSVLLVPDSEECLVGEVHLLINIANVVAREVVSLSELIVD